MSPDPNDRLNGSSRHRHTHPRRRLGTWMAGLLAAVAVGFVGATAFDPHVPEVASLRKELEALRASYAALRRVAERSAGSTKSPPVDHGVILAIGDAPFKGRADARFTLVEFSDYECGFCARHVRETMPQIEREYVATGKLRYVFRHYPIESIHLQAFKAHEGALCAGAQGRFWDMHDRLFANQSALAPRELLAHARVLGLDAQAFEQCLSGDAQGARVRRDLADGLEAGITGTPAFFLGVTTPSGDTPSGCSRRSWARSPTQSSRRPLTPSSPARRRTRQSVPD